MRGAGFRHALVAAALACAGGRARADGEVPGRVFTSQTCGSILEPLPGIFRTASACADALVRGPRSEYADFFSWGEGDSRCYPCPGQAVRQRWPDLFGGHDIYSTSELAGPRAPAPPRSPSPPRPPPSPPPPLGSGLLFPGYFCGDVRQPAATKALFPSACPERMRLFGASELAPYFAWSAETRMCYACARAQLGARTRNARFGVYRTADYKVELTPPHTDVDDPAAAAAASFGGLPTQRGSGCGTLLGAAESAFACARRVSEGARSLPFMSWSASARLCFACSSEQLQQLNADPAYDIYSVRGVLSALPAPPSPPSPPAPPIVSPPPPAPLPAANATSGLLFDGYGCGAFVSYGTPTPAACAERVRASSAADRSVRWFSLSRDGGCFRCDLAQLGRRQRSAGFSVFALEHFGGGGGGGAGGHGSPAPHAAGSAPPSAPPSAPHSAAAGTVPAAGRPLVEFAGARCGFKHWPDAVGVASAQACARELSGAGALRHFAYSERMQLCFRCDDAQVAGRWADTLYTIYAPRGGGGEVGAPSPPPPARRARPSARARRSPSPPPPSPTAAPPASPPPPPLVRSPPPPPPVSAALRAGVVAEGARCGSQLLSAGAADARACAKLAGARLVSASHFAFGARGGSRGACYACTLADAAARVHDAGFDLYSRALVEGDTQLPPAAVGGASAGSAHRARACERPLGDDGVGEQRGSRAPLRRGRTCGTVFVSGVDAPAQCAELALRMDAPAFSWSASSRLCFACAARHLAHDAPDGAGYSVYCTLPWIEGAHAPAALAPGAGGGAGGGGTRGVDAGGAHARAHPASAAAPARRAAPPPPAPPPPRSPSPDQPPPPPSPSPPPSHEPFSRPPTRAPAAANRGARAVAPSSAAAAPVSQPAAGARSAAPAPSAALSAARWGRTTLLVAAALALAVVGAMAAAVGAAAVIAAWRREGEAHAQLGPGETDEYDAHGGDAGRAHAHLAQLAGAGVRQGGAGSASPRAGSPHGAGSPKSGVGSRHGTSSTQPPQSSAHAHFEHAGGPPLIVDVIQLPPTPTSEREAARAGSSALDDAAEERRAAARAARGEEPADASRARPPRGVPSPSRARPAFKPAAHRELL